ARPTASRCIAAAAAIAARATRACRVRRSRNRAPATNRRFGSLLEPDLFGKPEVLFPDRALNQKSKWPGSVARPFLFSALAFLALVPDAPATVRVALSTAA